MKLQDLFESPYISNPLDRDFGQARAVALYNQYLLTKPRPIKKIDNFNVYRMSTKEFGGRRYRYLVLDPNGKDVTTSVVALLCIGEYLKGIFQVLTSFVLPKYRNLGLGKRLYLIPINEGLTLMSDNTQSFKAHDIWKSFIRDGKLKCFAINEYKPQERFPVELKDDKIYIKDTDILVTNSYLHICVHK
jgi:hypothetical protein